KVVAGVGKILDRFLVDHGGAGGPAGLDDRRFAGDLDLLLYGRELKGQDEGHRLPEPECHAVSYERGETGKADRDPVGAERHQKSAEPAGRVGRLALLEVRRGVSDRDRSSGEYRVRGIDDRSLDHSGGGL